MTSEHGFQRGCSECVAEQSNAHDAGDCLNSCSHPDHAFDGPVIDMDWLLRRLTLSSSEQYDLEVQRARTDGTPPVLL